MKKMEIKNISFSGLVSFPLLGNVREIVNTISLELSFGKCYCFNSELTKGGWGLSWIIAGLNKGDNGEILLDDNKIGLKERKKLSQCVGIANQDHLFSDKMSIKNQLHKGLKVTHYKNAKNITDIIKLFKINEEKIDRRIEHVSAMRFKASMAIGYSFDKKIFCFPWMDEKWLIDFKDLWLKELINILKDQNCLIIVPTRDNEVYRDLFDNVIKVKAY